MKRAVVLAAALVLLAAPALAAKPSVYRWPNVPAVQPETPGSVALMVLVRGSESWLQVDGLVVVPGQERAVCAPMRGRV